MPFAIVVTGSGRAALINAENTGTLPITVSQVGFSATAVTPAEEDTALPDEIKRIGGVSGLVVANDTIHLSALDSSADAYTARSIALYLADGTLFAIGGGPDPLFNKAAGSMAALAIDVVFADINAASIAFGDTNFVNPPASTTVQGVVELATVAEAQAGIDALRALTPASAKAAILGWLLTVDGAGSGLDADLLDGQQGSYYADIAGRLGFTPVNKAGDTMTGALSLPGAPTVAGHAARKDYVDSLVTAAAMLAKLITVDGAGSGLDADLLDGQDGAWYANIAARLGFSPVNKAGDTMAGLLTLSGVPTANLHAATKKYVDDAALGATLGYTPVDKAGDTMTGALGLPGAPTLAGHATRKDYVDGLATAVALLAKLITVDGAGSGLDSDLLDGQHGSYYTNIVARLGFSPLDATLYTASEILAKLLTVDGSGSGIDADLLDGQHASAFMLASGFSSGANANGSWCSLPDGTLIQRGQRVSGLDGWSPNYDFPTPFASGAVISIVASKTVVQPGSADGNDISAIAVSNSQFKIGSDEYIATPLCNWIAIGRG